MNIEFSITAFDDFPALKENKSKEILLRAPEVLRNNNYSVVYSSLIRMAALDASSSTKNIHRGLAERIQTFPDRKQVLIHLFDNISGADYLMQDRARNEASFTTDIRNYRPRQEPINNKCAISHTLTTSLNGVLLCSRMQAYKCILLDHEKLYLDNYIYYSSLMHGVHSGVRTLLVYVPYDLQSSDQGLQFLQDLCHEISKIIC